jgi:hypothetical protein
VACTIEMGRPNFHSLKYSLPIILNYFKLVKYKSCTLKRTTFLLGRSSNSQKKCKLKIQEVK